MNCSLCHGLRDLSKSVSLNEKVVSLTKHFSFALLAINLLAVLKNCRDNSFQNIFSSSKKGVCGISFKVFCVSLLFRFVLENELARQNNVKSSPLDVSIEQPLHQVPQDLIVQNTVSLSRTTAPVLKPMTRVLALNKKQKQIFLSSKFAQQVLKGK
ncbi:MAG: hypothetical protein ACOVOR_04240 [Rhabdochlamydiaceae bacterium]